MAESVGTAYDLGSFYMWIMDWNINRIYIGISIKKFTR